MREVHGLLGLYFVTPSAEQCYIIRFVVKEKVKPTEILHGLNAQYGEGTLSFARVCDGL
jgi:hypothetical protein